MPEITFQAHVENGTILIPEEYRQAIANSHIVQVSVLPLANEKNLIKKYKKISDAGILAALAKNPVSVPGIRSITRDQMHER